MTSVLVETHYSVFLSPVAVHLPPCRLKNRSKKAKICACRMSLQADHIEGCGYIALYGGLSAQMLAGN